MKPQRIRRRGAALAAVTAALAAASATAIGAFAGPATAGQTHAGTLAHTASASTLVMESSTTSTITDNFNPFDPQAPTYLIGGVDLIYEPLLQFNIANPTQVYDFLATSYKWGPAGKSI